MNILLIGGTGFLGLNIARALIESNHQVHVLDLNIKFSTLINNSVGVCGYYQIDGNNVKDVLMHIDRLEIECVINLASNLIPASSYQEYLQEQAVSAISGFELLNELAARGIRYVYFSSGGAIYGPSDHQTLNESASKNPVSYYGLGKSLFEESIIFASRTKGLNYLIIRPSNPFGPFQDPAKKQGLIAVLVDRMKKNQPIEIWGDGSVVRDYIWVGDLAQAIVKLIGKNHWNEVYNLGTGLGFSVNEVLEIIKSLVPTGSKITYSPPRSIDVDRIVLNIEKLQADIDFNPIGLAEGIELYLDRLKND
jgi:UDP-glucose 4-epimerase